MIDFYGSFYRLSRGDIYMLPLFAGNNPLTQFGHSVFAATLNLLLTAPGKTRRLIPAASWRWIFRVHFSVIPKRTGTWQGARFRTSAANFRVKNQKDRDMAGRPVQNICRKMVTTSCYGPKILHTTRAGKGLPSLVIISLISTNHIMYTYT